MTLAPESGRETTAGRRALVAMLLLHAALLVTLISGTLAPLFNDSAHRIGRGVDWFTLYRAGHAVGHGASAYSEPERVVPYAYPYRWPPGPVWFVGAPATLLPTRVSYWTAIGLLEAAWLAALFALRRRCRTHRTRFETTLLWLLFTPLWLDHWMGATGALAAVSLVLLGARGQRSRRRFEFLGAVAGAGHPLSPLALPALLRRRRWLAAGMMAGLALLAAGLEFGRHPEGFPRALRRFLDLTQHAGNIGLRGGLTPLFLRLGVNAIDPRLIAGGVTSFSLVVLAAAGLATWRARRPRWGPLLILWFVAWFLVSPQAWEHQLVLLLPGLVAMLGLPDAAARRRVFLCGLALALPSPFVLFDVERLGRGEFVDPEQVWPWPVTLLHHAWRLIPLLWLYGESLTALAPRTWPVPGRFVQRAALLLPAAAALFCLLRLGPQTDAFPIDDAYVHLVYARHLIQGHGFCFNLGEPSTGTSAPLWTLLVALLHTLPGSIFGWLLVVGALCMALSAALVARLAVQLAESWLGPDRRESHAVGLAAGLIVAVNGNVAWFAATGMETLLFVTLGLLTLELYWRRGLGWRVGLLLGGAALLRPEGCLVAGVVVAWELVARRGSPRAAALALAPGFLLVAPYALWVRHLTGNWLPSTFYGKTLTFVPTGFSLGAVGGFLWDLWNYWFFNDYAMRLEFWLALAGLTAIVVMILRYARRPEPLPARLGRGMSLALLLLLWGAAHTLAYACKFRSLYHHSRYLAPLYPLLAALAANGLAALMALPRLRGPRPAARLARTLLFGLALVPAAYGLAQFPYWSSTYRLNLNHIRKVHASASTWLRDHTPTDARVACFDIGVIGYLSQRYTVDLGGLTDPGIHPYLADHRCGPYLLQKRVGWLVHLDYPNPEYLTGIYKDAGIALRQTHLVDFEVPAYLQPVITHSSKMSIFRLEPLDFVLPHLAGGERFVPLDLSRVVNAALPGDPFRARGVPADPVWPDTAAAQDLFPELKAGPVEWAGIPFRLQPGLKAGERVANLTNCYGVPVDVTVALNPAASTGLWCALEGGRTLNCWDSCARFTVRYADGPDTVQPVVPYCDVWDYWQTAGVPAERVIRGRPDRPGHLTGLGIRLDPRRRPRELRIESTGRREAGIALFAITQVLRADAAGGGQP